MRDGLTFWGQTRAPLVAQLISGYIPAIKGIALDVGCGSAALTRELADRFERIIGLDIDHEAVHPQADRGLYLLTGDAMQLPLQSKCINFLFSYGALHHTQLSRALTEIKRVVAPGGIAVLIDFYGTESQAKTGNLKYLLTILRAFGGYRRRLGIVPALRISAYRLSSSWRQHLNRDVFLSEHRFVETYSAILASAHYYRHEDRMTVVWERPSVD